MNPRSYIVLIMLSLSLFTICHAQDNTKDKSYFPVLKGPYLGQKPPGMTPEVFASGIVSRPDYHEHSSPAFSPDGNEVYWSAHIGPRKQRMFHMKFEKGRWSRPEIMSFWKDRHGGGPVITPDGKRLIFYSVYPESHLAGTEFMNIWFTARIDMCKKARFPGVSPDGRYLFFCAYVDRDIEIYWVDAKIIEELKVLNNIHLK